MKERDKRRLDGKARENEARRRRETRAKEKVGGQK